MIERGEEKDETCLAQALDGQFRAQFDGYAESLQHVGRAAERSDGAVAVLGHPGAGSRGHQRRAGGDVEGQRSSAAGADHVHQFGSLFGRERQRGGAPAHDLDKAGQLRRLFSARGHHRQERRRLRLGHAAGQNLFQHTAGLLAGQRRAVLGQRFQQLLQRGHISLW